MEKDYSCPYCRREFNLVNRTLKIYQEHNYCEECSSDLEHELTMEHDMRDMDSDEFLDKYELLPLDKEQLKMEREEQRKYYRNIQSYLLLNRKWGPCSEHDIGIKYVCLDHKCFLCDTCILNQSHSGHDIVKVEEIPGFSKYSKLASEVGALSFIIEKFEKELLELWKKFRQSKERCFSAIQNALNTKEKELAKEILLYAEFERDYLKNARSEINTKEIKTYAECIKTKKDVRTFHAQHASDPLPCTIDEKDVLKACEMKYQEMKIVLENTFTERLNTLISQETPFRLANLRSNRFLFENDKLYFENEKLYSSITIDSYFTINSSNDRLEIILSAKRGGMKLIPKDWSLINKIVLRIEKKLDLEDSDLLKYMLSKIEKINCIKLIIGKDASLGIPILRMDHEPHEQRKFNVVSIIFQNVETLYNLEIDFSKVKNHCSHKEFEDLLQIDFPTMINLKTIRLNLFGSEISRKILRKLGSFLQKLDSLISLDLDIGGKLHNKDHNIFDVLKTMPQRLRAIKLGLNDINHFMLNKIDMENLYKVISAIQGLESLEVSLRNTGMTDEKAKYVLDLLECRMKSFRVNLKNNLEVTDGLVKPFLEKVESMKNLEHFYLDVSRTKVTQETLDMIEIFNQKLSLK